MFLMASAHYRTQLTVSEDQLHDAAEQVRRLRDVAGRLHRLEAADIPSDEPLVELARTVRQRYRAALDDDLNLSRGIGHIFELVREANTALDRGMVGAAGRRELLRALDEADAHLDVLRIEEEVLDADVERKIAERDEARSRKDYGTADRIREELAAVGIQLEDTAQGVRWRRSSG
jgi:cysteinyl-tRNA synthetase